MKPFVKIFIITLFTSLAFGCSKKSSDETEKVTRPETSDPLALEVLRKHDQSVASVMRTVREVKSSIKKDGTKMTPLIEQSITEMITEAKGFQSQLADLTDKLSKSDFDLFERNSKRLREKEIEFETLKQSK